MHGGEASVRAERAGKRAIGTGTGCSNYPDRGSHNCKELEGPTSVRCTRGLLQTPAGRPRRAGGAAGAHP
eukprot:8883992-Alexandrium_andersonii.AAC.1